MTEKLPTISKKKISPGVLYTEYVQMWLNRDDSRAVMNHKGREDFACDMAWHFHTNGTYSINYTSLPELISESFPDARLKEIEYLDSDVRTCNFFVRDAEGRYSFIHKSFLEYFVALKLVKDIEHGFCITLDTLLTPQIVGFMADLIVARSIDQKSLIEMLSSEKSPIVRGNIAMLLCVLGIVLKAETLHGACLRRAELNGIKIIDSDLRNADLSSASLVDTDFSRSVLIEADMSFSQFENAILSDTDLRRSKCRGTSFIGASLNSIKGQDSDWEKVDLSNAILDRANLSGSNLKGAHLQNTSANHCQFDKVNFECASIKDIKIEGASFVGANLERAIFYPDIRSTVKACFAKAKLSGIQVMNTSLYNYLLKSSSSKCEPGKHICESLGRDTTTAGN